MLRNLFRTFLSQSNQKAATFPCAANCVDASQLKLVAGGLPKGGWLEPESTVVSGLPKGGWA